MVRNDGKISWATRITPRRNWPGLTFPTSRTGFCQGYFCPWQSSSSLIAGPYGALSPTWRVGTFPPFSLCSFCCTNYLPWQWGWTNSPPRSFCAFKIRAEASCRCARLVTRKEKTEQVVKWDWVWEAVRPGFKSWLTLAVIVIILAGITVSIYARHRDLLSDVIYLSHQLSGNRGLGWLVMKTLAQVTWLGPVSYSGLYLSQSHALNDSAFEL